MAEDGKVTLPQRRDPDLTSLAAFTLDTWGKVTSWSVTATRLYGHPPQSVLGRDVRDVLIHGPGQRDLVDHALSETAAGRVWTVTLIMTFAGGDGPVMVRFEPLAGSSAGTLVIAQHSSPQPGPGWLSEAAAKIGTTLDLGRTAGEVVDIAVPSFADLASIFVAERLLAAGEFTSPSADQGAVVRRLAARISGHPATITHSLLRPGEAVFFHHGSPSFKAMTTGQPVIFDELDEESLERLARRPGGREAATRYTSFLSAPLAARGAVVGCTTFARSAGRPPFGPADISAAEELLSRAAVCIDNARLYDRERRTALALQRGLLPGTPEIPPGMEVSNLYLPVGASVVGGDWHDIIPVAGGRAVLIVGDAMGHGPEAAAVMVQLRTAAHTLAALDLPPGQVLRTLDELAAGMDAPFATCIYAVIDPGDSSCLVAQAGHPPPVLALPGGNTRVLELPPGLPLGLGVGSYEATRIGLPQGTTLALYTDGLVESRTRALDDGLAVLRNALSEALAGPGTPLDEVSGTVSRALRQQGEDDITLVLARVRS
jgi:hypothetical protein